MRRSGGWCGGGEELESTRWAKVISSGRERRRSVQVGRCGGAVGGEGGGGIWYGAGAGPAVKGDAKLPAVAATAIVPLPARARF